MRYSFSKWYEQGSESSVARESKNMESYNKKIQDLQKKIEAASKVSVYEGIPSEDFVSETGRQIRKYKNLISKSKGLIDAASGSSNEATSKLKKLKEHPLVEDVWVDDAEHLSIVTKNLKHSGGKMLGRFRIVINNKPEDRQILCMNLNWGCRDAGYRDHWAINDFYPCLGDYGDGIYDLLRRKDLFLFTDNMIHYIRESGDESAYMPMESWFNERFRLSAVESKKKEVCQPMSWSIMQSNWTETMMKMMIGEMLEAKPLDKIPRVEDLPESFSELVAGMSSFYLIGASPSVRAESVDRIVSWAQTNLGDHWFRTYAGESQGSPCYIIPTPRGNGINYSGGAWWDDTVSNTRIAIKKEQLFRDTDTNLQLIVAEVQRKEEEQSKAIKEAVAIAKESENPDNFPF